MPQHLEFAGCDGCRLSVYTLTSNSNLDRGVSVTSALDFQGSDDDFRRHLDRRQTVSRDYRPMIDGQPSAR
ncbi:MAG: hypothetical protein ACLT76_06455 [Clostridium fessum]